MFKHNSPKIPGVGNREQFHKIRTMFGFSRTRGGMGTRLGIAINRRGDFGNTVPRGVPMWDRQQVEAGGALGWRDQTIPSNFSALVAEAEIDGGRMD